MQKTIEIVVEIGLVPNGQHNLETAARRLGMAADTGLLSRLIQDWREGLAEHFRGQLDSHGEL